MKQHSVVVNDCARPAVASPLQVRTLNTQHGRQNFTLQFGDLAKGLPGFLDDRQLDWLEILGHLFATDIACERGAGDVEWNRNINVWLPVRDPDYWSMQRGLIEGIWTDLTEDDLTIHFEPALDPASPPRPAQQEFRPHDCVALVSGGQDSFTGALQHLADGGRPLLLSHTASGATSSAQQSVEAFLRAEYPAMERIRLGAAKTPNQFFPGHESSQRSRTFLFLAAACVVAIVGGSNRVLLNENGIMAIHVPLTLARIGSYSTHTASPPLIERIQRLASHVFGVELTVQNNLVHMTKPEVVALAASLGHGRQMAHTVSCWSIGRSRRHCGFCSPCLMRRISCEWAQVGDVEYERDAFDDPSSLDDGRARDNVVHMLSVLQDLQELPDDELLYEYPELLNGHPALATQQVLELHRRWADQAQTVLGGHTVPARLM